MAQDKKVALITGANRGIGLETAKQLGEQGVTVLVGARSLQVAAEDAKVTAAKLKQSGIDAYPVQLDVVNEAGSQGCREIHRGEIRQAGHSYQQCRHQREHRLHQRSQRNQRR